jgi:3-phytase/alkaline phosphatase D
METIRFATFNASLNRSNEGQLINDLFNSNNSQAKAIAEIIQRTNPDVLLINEFDFDPTGEAAQLFQENYLSIAQNGSNPIDYPFFFIAPSNTGIASGLDLDNNSSIGGPNDAFGFGFFPGQFGMVVYSKYPIALEGVRTFQNFLWKDMPNALLPDNPQTPEPQDWYSPEELEQFRLSSKSHWDLPIQVGEEIVHLLVSHPTPPVFDGAEDRNGTRNHDEIRFWADYITPGKNGYIYDDNGNYGGLAAGSRFVIMGDQNADPLDGDSTNKPIDLLLNSPLINTSVTPSSEGGVEAAILQGEKNNEHIGDPRFDTSDFGDTGFNPGNLRVDYVLPSKDLDIVDAGIFWPLQNDSLGYLANSSDHRLIYADVQTQPLIPNLNRQIVRGVEFLGEVKLSTGIQFEDTELGGLSGIVYDRVNKVYYSVSDDRSQIDPARYYTLKIDLNDGKLNEGDITFLDVTTLTDIDGQTFPARSLDPEGIALTTQGTLFISSEGDTNNLINPFINEFALNGKKFASLPIADRFLPTVNNTTGIRNNLAFESLTISPDGRFLYSATENALFQDGLAADLGQNSRSRIIKYDLATRKSVGEFIYTIDPVPLAPEPENGFRTNGLVELVALDNNGSFLALERAFSNGKGNTVKLYQVNLQGALDISSQDSLGNIEEIDGAVRKKLLVDFADLGIVPDNLEGLALGPKLVDGRQSLLVVSDNNFSPTQTTQFIALALDLDTLPTALPQVETPDVLDLDEASLPGDADDPAIWINSVDPSASIIIGTLKDGGLAVFDLQGRVLEVIDPEKVRYNNVDVIYGFKLGDATVDLAIASDRRNDTLAIWAIEPDTRKLVNITAENILGSIFGVDDGEKTAYGLTSYRSLVSDRDYVFVTQRDGNLVAQLELIDNGNGRVTGQLVRTIELPLFSEDFQAEGLVVDRELGYLYVAIEDFGILKLSAEPDGGNDYTVVQAIGENLEVSDIEGLTIYYGEDGTGYLLASEQGDSSYALFSREGTNEYLGSLAIGDRGAIDQANDSDGLELVNVSLGPDYPNGLLVVQDGVNDTQVLVTDDGELENINTNFKFVSWDAVANSFENKLQINNHSFDPRNPEANSLVNGISSGDTTQNSTLLWARSTFKGEVSFEYSLDSSFNTIAGIIKTSVTDTALPVKVFLEGLIPNTQYYYRVTDAAGDSAVGKFLTAASLGEYQGLKFGVSGDWRGELAPYPAIDNVKDLAFFVKHGDTIYADVPSPGLLDLDGTKKEQAETLAEYRLKHNEVYSTRFGANSWSELQASTSILATIDDHEVINDFSGGAPLTSDPRFGDGEGLINDSILYENGLQAFQEYNAIRDEFYGDTGDDRTAGERKLYRYQTYGSDAAAIVLDNRSFRDRPLQTANLGDPNDVVRFLSESLNLDRTMLGEVQLEDLKKDLLAAQLDGVTWKFVMVPEPMQNFGAGLAEDRFEGYAKERTEILDFINSNAIDNVVFVAADIHGTVVNNLTYQKTLGGPQIATNAWEISTGAIAYAPPFGPAVTDLFLANDREFQDFYNSLPIINDADSTVNDKDDFLKQLINQGLDALGYDRVGLNDNLAVAAEKINATLLQGDYLATHTYGWTEFDIDRHTQALKVTTYGIDWYGEEELLLAPVEVLNREPKIVSQFVVSPNGKELIGTGDRDLLEGTPGRDSLEGKGGRDTLIGGLGKDDFIYTSVNDGGDFISDFEIGEDRIILTSILDSFSYQGNNAILDGYLLIEAIGSDAVIKLDPDGFAGSGRSRPFIVVETIVAADLNNLNNFSI